MPIQPRTHPILLGLLLGSGLACNDPPSGLQERIDAMVAGSIRPTVDTRMGRLTPAR